MQVAHPKTKSELLEAFGSRQRVRVNVTEEGAVLPTSVIGVVRSLRHDDESGHRFGAVIVNSDTRELWDGSLGVFE